MSVSSTLPLAVQLPAGTWQIDPAHSRIGFVARHMMVSKVRGGFGEYSADVVVADDPFASTVVAEVAMASIDTGNPDRDAHLRTNDFFDVPNHPTMTFRSTSIEPTEDGDYVLHGDLTLRGVTRPVAFDLEFHGVTAEDGGARGGFSATTEINRTDFGVNFNAALETGGVLIGEKVKVELEIALVTA